MRIIFIGGIFDDKNRNEIEDNSIGPIQYAADALQKSFLRGLKSFYKSIVILNMPFIGSYPIRFKKINLKLIDTYFEDIPVKNIPFVNLTFYKLFSRFLNLSKPLKEELKETIPTTILLYSIHIPHILVSVLAKKKYIKIVLIVPDLPEFMSSENKFPRKIILKLQNILLERLYKKIDGFIVLTESMVDKLQVPIEKTCVIEGMYSDSKNEIEQNEDIKTTDTVIRVLYSGILDKRYGIIDLVSQFHKIKDSNYELIICGAGDGESEIIELAQKDSRIKFQGQKTREYVLALQKEVSILINPRKPEEFTKYSFPSKTMEYLASGTPTIIYRLEGIPKEYFEYCITCDESVADDIMNKILYVGRKTPNERHEIGQKAKQFILSKKNPFEQVSKLKKIIDNF